MTDYISTIKPSYPIVERVLFSTEVISLNSLKQAAYGSLVRMDTQTNMPKPFYNIKESILKNTITSEEIDNLREQRRPRYEAALRRYPLHFDNVNADERTAIKAFFTNRKGRFNNFSVQYAEASPYTEFSMFEGAITTVNFDSDMLEISMITPGRFSIEIPIVEASNSLRFQKQFTTAHEFSLNYSVEDLTDLITFFEDTASGKDIIFNFNPYSMVSNYLENTTYTVRFDMETFDRDIKQIEQDMVSVNLKGVIT